MSDGFSERLAIRFRDDAEALRARASVLAARARSERGGGGPDAAACQAMAAACDRVSTFFATDRDADLRTAAAELEALRDAESSPDVRHVYAGAITRVRQALAPETDDDDEG